jgi:hypothetical protein
MTVGEDWEVGANYKLAVARAWARRWKALARRERGRGRHLERVIDRSRAEVERLRAALVRADEWMEGCTCCRVPASCDGLCEGSAARRALAATREPTP